MRSLLGLSVLLVVGCSNACPAPVLCTEPHPDYCPCLIPDGGSMPPDAYVDPVDAFVVPTDDAAVDAGASDANVDANVDAH